jgi:ubiquinol oxidase
MAFAILRPMKLERHDEAFEALHASLYEQSTHDAYKKKYDGYRAGFVPRLLGGFLIMLGNILYGRAPSYGKFRAIEIIARVPYQSWASVSYTYLTLYFKNASRALALSKQAKYAEYAQANETMHVVVISEIAAREGRLGYFRFTLIPMLFAFIYFWCSYLMYFFYPRWSYELNFLFETHAYRQYDQFLNEHEQTLKCKPIASEFLSWYGRTPHNQYDFFLSVRNDELIHRTTSLEELGH